ncbi:hypothetical protein Tco_1347185 [Tanacetum coccineum]
MLRGILSVRYMRQGDVSCRHCKVGRGGAAGGLGGGAVVAGARLTWERCVGAVKYGRLWEVDIGSVNWGCVVGAK